MTAGKDKRGLEADDAALDGIKVIDLSRVLAGPWATQLLADLGADVVKVERPDGGDETRTWGPPWFEGADGAREAAYFVCANRGKRSIAIDISTQEGAATVRRLAAESDVLIENFKVGGLRKYGLDYETLKAANPRLIYCSLTGFGQTGPYAARPGYDFIIQAAGGLMSVTGEPDGPPMKAGVALVDILTGLYAANGILAALHQRERTGLGQHIDANLLDVQVATLANQMANVMASGRDPVRHGNAHPNIVPYQSFETSDGMIAVAVGNDGQFARLCAALGRSDLSADARYRTNADRQSNRRNLIAELAGATIRHPTERLLADLAAADVPAGPVNSLTGVLADPHVIDRGMAIRMPHSTIGEIPGIACPISLSASTSRARRGPPGLGEHTEEILAELGPGPAIPTMSGENS